MLSSCLSFLGMNPIQLAFRKGLILGYFFLLFSSSVHSKEKWYSAEIENFLIFSNAPVGQTKATIEELLNIQYTLSKVFPTIAGKSEKKIRVVIAKNDSTIKRFSGLYEGKPKPIGGMFTKDLEGDLLLINLGGRFDLIRPTIYHEYVHFLTISRSFYIPPWLGEGIAETFSTIEITRKGAKVGLGNVSSVAVLRNNKLIPFDRFFQITHGSPEYNSSKHGQGIFYAQSWALIHYLLYGKNDLQKGTLKRLVDMATGNQFIDEANFQLATGITFAELEKRLIRYVSTGKYSYRIYPITKKRKIDIALNEIEEGEVALIHGMLKLKTRGTKEAYPHISKAYELLPDSPRAAAYLGYYLYEQDLFNRAADRFQEAIDKGSETPATYLYRASAYMRHQNPNYNMSGIYYDRKETFMLLTALFKARELGETRDTLYHRIGEVWIGSNAKPTEGNLGAIHEGLRLYPDDLHMKYCLASLYLKTNQIEDARTLVDHALTDPKVGRRAKNFEYLKNQIESMKDHK